MLKPLAGYVLIKPAPKETKTASGIVLPESVDEKPQEGKVLACGDDLVEEGKTIKCPVKIGDKAVYKKWGGNEIKAGVDKLAKAVATTLGPKGRNVALDKKWGAPSVIHDGVTVAKEIELEDPFENMGASLVKEAASKTSDVAGDGTTTATVLAQAMVEEGLKNITAGVNPMTLKKGVEKASEAVVEELKKMAKKVIGQEDIEKIATISAADSTIGKLIADALQKVGPDGVVTVEEGKGLELSVEYKEGMEFDRGFVSPYFVTDPDKMQAIVEDAHILITDQKITSLNDLLQFLENFVKVSKNLVIISY